MVMFILSIKKGLMYYLRERYAKIIYYYLPEEIYGNTGWDRYTDLSDVSYKRTWWIKGREYLYFKIIQIKLLQLAEPILFYLSKLFFIYFIIFNEY